MPPPKSGDRLTAAQVETLRRWIAEGADWEEHWSYVPPQRPRRSRRPGHGWAANPIDRFLLARLEERGLAPSPEADRVTLIRRLSLRPDRPAADAGGGRRVRRPTHGPTPTSGWSTGCSPRPTTASGWRCTGSTWSATPTRSATTATVERSISLVPRLRDRRVQRQHAVRPVHDRATRRRPAARRRRVEQQRRVGLQPAAA